MSWIPVLLALALQNPDPAAELLPVRVTGQSGGGEGGSTITIAVDREPFTVLRAGDASKPYAWPLIGPTGVAMTRSYPMEELEGEARDHPHHRSLWFAHGDVGGHDFWHGVETRIVESAPAEVETDGPVLRIRSSYEWRTEADELVCTEARTTTLRATETERTIDFEITLHATDEPLVFGDTKEGTLALRLRPELRVKGDRAAGHMRNAAGDEDGACWGKRAAWATSWGPVEGEVVGLTLFDHPENHAHPTWWHARDYGLFAANPFGAHDFEGAEPGTGELIVPADGSVTFRYRLVLHAAAPDFEAIRVAYDAWAAEER